MHRIKTFLLPLTTGILALGCSVPAEDLANQEQQDIETKALASPFWPHLVCVATKETVVNIFNDDGISRVTAFALDSDLTFRIVGLTLQATPDFIHAPCEVDKVNKRMTCMQKDWPYFSFLVRHQNSTFVLQSEEFTSPYDDGNGRHRTIAGHCKGVG
jgi:hypothetical protein